MGRDPQSTDRRTPLAPHDADRLAAAGTARARPSSAIATVVTIVLLCAMFFLALAALLHSDIGPGAAGSVTPTVVRSIATTASAATPTALALPAGTSVVSIAMVSASDGWAIAAPTASSALLVHYTGGRWMLSGYTYEGIELTDISMDTHDDGWAVGLYADQSGGVVLHYSSGRWDPVPTPQISFAGERVWAFSPSQALVLASLPSQQSALLHYDDGVWTEAASPRGITDMSVLSANDVWATCFDGHILHEQGDRWTTYTIGGQASGLGTQPLSISMLSDSNGWVAGLTNVSSQGMFLVRFDGQTWTRIQGPAASGPTEIHSIAMVSPTEGWAGGDLLNSTGTEAVMLHYVNGQWVTTPAPSSGGIGKIVMVSATEGWAAVGGAAEGLLHYQKGYWTPFQSA
jgi:hypothetical protein